ncbi:MAG: hypothetical protein JNK75_10405 [Betaproteobacteria bacterium]|nr:hypothetical protein [Betaproteobacteria bacterium]
MASDVSVPGGIIRWRLYLPAAAARVFDALATDAGRAAFWAESAIEREGAVHFRFINGATEVAHILARERPHRFALEYFGSPAEFLLAAAGPDATDLTLTQNGVAMAEWHAVHAGWLNVLLPLKAWLVHGVDLRNHDAARTWDQGYADQ